MYDLMIEIFPRKGLTGNDVFWQNSWIENFVWILTLGAGIWSCLLTKECSHFSGKVVWIFHKPDANIWVVHWFVNIRY